MLADLRDTEHVLALPCGERSIRFRPALSVEDDEIELAVAAIGRSTRRVAAPVPVGATVKESL